MKVQCKHTQRYTWCTVYIVCAPCTCIVHCKITHRYTFRVHYILQVWHTVWKHSRGLCAWNLNANCTHNSTTYVRNTLWVNSQGYDARAVYNVSVITEARWTCSVSCKCTNKGTVHVKCTLLLHSCFTLLLHSGFTLLLHSRCTL